MWFMAVVSRAVAWDWARLPTIVLLIAMFLVNLGFWVGSCGGTTWTGCTAPTPASRT